MLKYRKHRKSVEESPSVTTRAVLIALALIPLNSFWIMQIEIVWYSGHPTCASLFFNTVFILLLLTVLSLAIKRFFPQWAFSQGELLTVYIMLNIASSIASHDMLQILIPLIPHVLWYATPENEWNELFAKDVPRWLSIQGNSTLYFAQHLKAWFMPMLWWAAFICVLLFMMLCINILVRKQWAEDEKLAYPIIQLPLAVTENSGKASLFSSRMMWLGFALAAGVDLLNGISFFELSVPSIPLKCSQHNIGKYFTESPWSAVGWLPLSFYPFAVGLSFFLPLDLSFSIWFFYLFRKGQQILARALGMSSLPGFPYLNAQSSGAWIGLAILAVWISRRHLSAVLKEAVNGRPVRDNYHSQVRREPHPPTHPLSYRWALVGLLSGWLFLLFFCVRAGMSFWVVVSFFMLYFGISTAITRMRAELGPPTHELTPMNAGHILVDVFGTRRLGSANLTPISFFWFFNRSYRNHPMPIQLEAFKMAERTGINVKRLTWAMMLAAVVAVPVSFWALLHISYREGGAPGRGFAFESLNRLQAWVAFPTSPDAAAIGFMGLGMVFTFLLMAMRMRFLWWPCHPAGYALSTNFGVDYIWFCLVISSAAKAVILRYGGLKTHRKAVPFFLGLILGEFTVGSFWSALSVLLQTRTYTFWIF
ncbi:hypothetical protein HYR99_16360 [Candidatus Poribacteria bacterium]|nr:hypothetical protein [Candidatus Poribacteria bacterium]